MRIKVLVSGCDDQTEVDMDLSQRQVDAIRLLESLINAKREHHCQPNIEVTEL